MKLFTILLSAFIVTSNAQALEFNYGVVGGLQMVDGDENTPGFTDNGKIGWKLGALASMGLGEKLTLTSGVIYNDRPYEVESYASRVKFKLTYVDVPVLVRYSLGESFGVYAGPVLAFNISDSTQLTDLNGGGSVTADNGSVKSFMPLAEVGVNFKYEHCGVDIYYQRGFGDIVDNGPKDISSVGANYIYWF